ncbi:MAG: glycosyltransferase family 4 protein [bacterium]|nr:glycosyltransferase family 4 protein [bacterium]
MGKIRILYLIDVFYAFGGAERNLFDIVKYIDKEKFEPYVFVLKAGPEFAEFNKLGVFAENLDVKRIYSPKGIKSLFKLVEFVKKENVDIIVSYHEGSDILAVLLGKLAGIKAVISSRRDMGYQLKKHHIFIYRIINKYFRQIVTVSQSVAQIIAQREKVPASKMVTIYNGVDFARTRDVNVFTVEELTRLGIDKNKKLVGTLATFRKIKGLEYFIEAADIIARENQHIQFLIIGKAAINDRPYDLSLETKASSKNIKFVEFQKDISRIIHLLDIVVVPSLSEGFSNTIIEAMAVAKPVVATNVGGNPEAVIDGVTGILVPLADSQSLAAAILSILNNPVLEKTLGEKGFFRVQEKFSLKQMISSYEALYLSVLQK